MQNEYDNVKRLFSDKFWRLNHLYHIRDKDGRIVKFKMNDAQTNFFLTRHNRNIQLKARQKGFTTLAIIDSLDDCLFKNNFEAGLIAHSLDDAKKIFDKAKLAFERLPEWLKKYRKPTTDKTGEYKFPNGSVFSVDTSFRGGTLSRLHVSEFGKISKKYPEKAKEIRTGAFEAVPKDGIIDVESTAEGMSGDFYDLCEEAMPKDASKLTSLEFKFYFDPWWSSDEYQIESTVEIDEEMVKYFTYLETDHNVKLSKNQKSWYVLKKGSLKGEMHQEYPSYPEEAFLASGRPYFSQLQISKEIARTKKQESAIKYFTIKSMSDSEFTIPVKIFKQPEKEMAYAVAGDPAEGLEHGDNSALSVLDRKMRQCATYAGKLDPDLFGALMVEVAKFYNTAIVAPEVNNHGHAVIQAIKMRKYYKFFKRETKEEIGKDIQDRVGWLNTVKSKMELLDDLKESFRDESLEINDEDTLREMLKCVIEEDGNVILNGKDRVVALGISIQAIKQASIENEHKAFVPSKKFEKDVTKMSIEDKIKYYNRIQRQ